MKPTARIFRNLLLTPLFAGLLATAPVVLHAAPGEGVAKVHSLRGTDVQAPDPETDMFRPERDRGPIERNFVQQPPIIPHTVQNYTITKNFNKCMDCHSWSRYKETGATKISLTHFKDRSGTDHANISTRRYFCLQCHVPQSDAKPLVENTFKPASALQ
ncbi:MAG: nitrate reductase cytochrome c-type subunit [Sulfurimicrobium sp.]